MMSVLIDVDGVMTDGTFWYTEDGKAMKRFGPDDADALSILRGYYVIRFVTADERGLKITKRRIVNDMGYDLDVVSQHERLDYINANYQMGHTCIYIADGFLDAPALEAATYGIAPANAHPYAKRAADHVLRRGGGDRAVAEACNHLLVKFKNTDLRAQS